MKSSQSLRFTILMLLTAIVMLIVSSCAGGGTSGTGLRITGTVIDNNGAPLLGITVATSDGATVATTDEQGEFELSGLAASESVLLDLNGPQVDDQAEVQVGIDVVEVSVALTIDTAEETVSEIEVIARATPTPKPTRSPKATKTPTPEPTPRFKPTRSPTPTPTERFPKITATPTPTESPRATKTPRPKPTKTKRPKKTPPAGDEMTPTPTAIPSATN